MFIAEQQLVAAAVGMQVRGWMPFASTFAAFLSRAYDFVRMAAISRANIRLSGSHAGVSIGEDGPSQMALEDIASFRAIHGSTVLHPSRRQPDGASSSPRWPTATGISFIRTLRGKTPGAHARRTRTSRIGGSRVAARRRRRRDRRLRHHASTRRSRPPSALAGDGVNARVLDAYSIKPIDAEAVRAAARECGAIVTVEDHWPEGGLGDAVLDALAEADDRAARWSSSRCARCRARARPRSCCTARASTPRRSPTRPKLVAAPA